MWELDYKEGRVTKNWCFWIVVLEKTLESPLDCKEIKPVNSKGNQPWIFIGRTDAKAEAPKLVTWCKELTYWKRPWCQERLKAGEGDNRGWDVWMASLTQWTWALASPWRWQRRGKPGCVLQFMGSQRVGHDWVTEQQQSSPPTPYPWNVYLTCLLWSQKLPHRYSLEVAIWCFEPTDDICDWTQLRPLFKLLGLAGMYRDSLGLWLPKTI